MFWREADKPWVPSVLFSGENWHTSKVTDTRLAACVHAKPGKKAGECSFKGAKKLELLDTAYTVRIVELATGKTLGERTVEAKSGRCPSFWDFSGGSRRFAYMGNDTKSWIAAFATAQGCEHGRPTLRVLDQRTHREIGLMVPDITTHCVRAYNRADTKGSKEHC